MVEVLQDDTSSNPVEAKTRGSLIQPFDLIGEEDMPRIGGKVASLVVLRRIGMPVPDGFCATTDVHDYYLANSALPDDLVSEIVQAKNALGGKVAIRSSANCEDGRQLSMAGVFESHYVYDDADIPRVVKSVFDQAHSDQVGQFMAVHGKSVGDIRMGLVIQKLIDEPEAAGVVYTGINGDNLLVQYVDGFGAKLVDGKTTGSALLVDRDGEIAESTGFEARPLPKSVVDKLAEYSYAIEEFFSGVPQDIEFVYKDGSVYIVQARTLTTDIGVVDLQETPDECLEATKQRLRRLVSEEKRVLGTRTAILSDANYSELLPKPTEMDIGVYMYIWGGSDGIPGAKQLGHAAMGYQVGEPGQIINYIGGRTYSSIAYYAAIYHAGFPESREEYFATLVNEYLQAIKEDPEKGAYPQMGLFLQDPTLEDLQARFGDRAGEYLQVYQGFTARMRTLADDFMNQFWNREFPETTNFVSDKKMLDLNGMTNKELLAHGIEVLEHLRTKSFVNFVKAARLGFYYSQRLQDVLQKTLGLGKEDSQKMYSRLNQGLDGSLVTYANTAIAEADSEEAAVAVANQLVGHYSTGEMLEIRHKPLRDVPDALLTYVRGIRKTDYKQQFERQKEARLQAERSLLDSLPDDKRKELEEIMRPSQVYMALRETIKHLSTMDYLLLRDVLEVLGSRLGLADVKYNINMCIVII